MASKIHKQRFGRVYKKHITRRTYSLISVSNPAASKRSWSEKCSISVIAVGQCVRGEDLVPRHIGAMIGTPERRNTKEERKRKREEDRGRERKREIDERERDARKTETRERDAKDARRERRERDECTCASDAPHHSVLAE